MLCRGGHAARGLLFAFDGKDDAVEGALGIIEFVPDVLQPDAKVNQKVEQVAVVGRANSGYRGQEVSPDVRDLLGDIGQADVDFRCVGVGPLQTTFEDLKRVIPGLIKARVV